MDIPDSDLSQGYPDISQNPESYPRGRVRRDSRWAFHTQPAALSRHGLLVTQGYIEGIPQGPKNVQIRQP
jgi:hypothetical protein